MPWGKKYIHQKSQVGFLCWYGFKRHNSALTRHGCALKLPSPGGMECLETSLLRSNLVYSLWTGQSASPDTMRTHKNKRCTHIQLQKGHTFRRMDSLGVSDRLCSRRLRVCQIWCNRNTMFWCIQSCTISTFFLISVHFNFCFNTALRNTVFAWFHKILSLMSQCSRIVQHFW